MTTLRSARVRAPELTGRGWLNTDGTPLRLSDLHGKVVLLDFWTFCCINCLHVLDELRPLEEEFADVLVVVGVHSPKFDHERDPDALAAAVERYEVTHPVLDDPDLVTWQAYAARAWPTLSVVDPEGYVVATMTGEGHAEGLARLLAELVAEHEAKGTLRRGDGPAVAPPPAGTELRFPGKVAALPGGTLLVSDTAHHSLVELAADGETVLRRIGSGDRGSDDGDPATASFSEPQGVAVLPAEVAAAVGYDLVVADSVNHLLRSVRLADGEVRTVGGTGRQWRAAAETDDARSVDLSSPWDAVWWAAADPPPDGLVDGMVAIAMAGIHQLWWFDPRTSRVGVLAGTTTEGLQDGPLDAAWLAQPCGLAADGERLWVADSEVSALRRVEDGEVHTAVGEGLFDFGHVDGPAGQARLQHPLGVAVLPDASIAVLDTYNHAVRRFDPESGEVSTLATDVAEPSGAVVVDDTLVVVESAAHRLSRPVAPGVMRTVAGEARRTRRPATDLAAGDVTLDVVFEPAPGQQLDDRYGPPTRVEVSASPPELLLDGAGVGTDLVRTLRLSGAVEAGVLHVTAQAAACDHGVENPACHLTRQDWGIPVRVRPDGAGRLGLVLRGLDG